MRTFKEFKRDFERRAKYYIPNKQIYVTKKGVYCGFILMIPFKHDIENILNDPPFLGVSSFETLVSIMVGGLYYRTYGKWIGDEDGA